MYRKKVKYNIGEDINFKILISHNVKTLGFFDVNEESDSPYFIHNSNTIDGICESRLIELENVKRTTNFNEKYIMRFGYNNGVDYENSVENQYITYYIGNVKYVDNIIDNVTYYTYTTNGLNNTNSIKRKMYYDVSKYNSVFLPVIESDIDIDRFSVNVFEPFFRIGYTNSMDDIYECDGGLIFNILKNE